MYPRAGHLRQPPSGDSGHGPGRGPGAQVHSIPKNASRGQYAQATALEALLGWLYLQGRLERINELFGIILDESDETDEKG